MATISSSTANKKINHNRYALRFGLLTAIVIFIYNLLVNAITQNPREGAHFLIFGILFAMIAFAFYQTKAQFPAENAINGRVVFGLKMAGVAALSTVFLNLISFAVNHNLEVSEINQPIDDFGKFAVNAMGTVFGFLAFGFFSALVLAFFYEKP